MSHATSLPSLPVPRDVVASLPVYSKAGGALAPLWRASSNESFLTPSPAVLAAIGSAAQHCQQYPTIDGDPLIKALSQQLGIAQDLLVTGGGSLAVLQQLLTAFAGPGKDVVFAWRSYEAYPILVRLTGALDVQVPLTANHRHDLPAMAHAVTDSTAAIILCSPNNPTGTVLGSQELEEFLASIPAHVLVVLDQAYLEFTDDAETSFQHSLTLRVKYPNLVLLRTFSKAYGLAGLRAGFLVAHPDISRHVRAVSPPFGLNAVAESASVAALADTEALAANIATVRAGRSNLQAQLAARGIDVPASGGNFLWLPVGDASAALEGACLAESVSVRCFPGEGVRVSVGSRQAEAAVLSGVDRWQRS
ncbi:histidinol-phosphate transaminase [Arthrobacter psychrochitiniphilus]|uniref:Aminotransferase n=1 Tax=Arthrobacter psychrochitiniphilus TaxID=291045 RepID=A0A2V3DNX0_9MICC|nr:histidinol-phosphate transaminase [Arthrobacter psychrochitiniphilus]NYG18107.1 histidinol-phosphate aminotransferase [Arthrobacter psychrochitiniphilus]PXA64179.1 aminotransferase [Arthrobacter psychrochitiniphilus]